jgi:hypothetical protein
VTAEDMTIRCSDDPGLVFSPSFPESVTDSVDDRRYR